MLQISLKRKHGLLLLLFGTFFSFFATVFLLLVFLVRSLFISIVFFFCLFLFTFCSRGFVHTDAWSPMPIAESWSLADNRPFWHVI